MIDSYTNRFPAPSSRQGQWSKSFEHIDITRRFSIILDMVYILGYFIKVLQDEFIRMNDRLVTVYSFQQ